LKFKRVVLSPERLRDYYWYDDVALGLLCPLISFQKEEEKKKKQRYAGSLLLASLSL
jgi:hypothetical protein